MADNGQGPGYDERVNDSWSFSAILFFDKKLKRFTKMRRSQDDI